ncbi:hypothetical protein BX600DRAFT_473736 [Xylariales sp. PMI_506]|nr:hypothetical protein BX600DRAFT_473736 [Xylariales sp. PMI_506]
MRDIYGSANNVVIYLGEDTDGSLSRAIQLFDTLNDKATSREAARRENRQVETPSFVRGQLPPAFDEGWYRIHDLFNRPWFTRIWVVQEVVAASSDPEVLCGPFVRPWSDVARVAEFMHEIGITGATIRTSNTINVARVREFRDRRLMLFQLIQRTLRYQATDPRDKLFALYGLVCDKERDILAGSKYFEINYEKPVRDVYRDAVLGYIQHYGSFEMACGISGSEETSVVGLPSWVPDFTKSIHDRHPPVAALADFAQFDAAGGRSILVSILEDPNMLRVAGRSHDAVEWVSEPFDEPDVSPFFYKRRPQSLQKVWDEVVRRLGKDPEIREAFWRTLIMNVDLNGKPVSTEEYYPFFLKYWHDSKRDDKSALEYLQNNQSRQGPLNEEEERLLFQEAEEIGNKSMSIEEFNAFKKWADGYASRFLPCKACEDCLHCIATKYPENMLQDGSTVIVGHSPALPFKDTDPFITDYFELLRSSSTIVMIDSNLHFLSRLRATLMNRVFFITKGGLMGLGPRHTASGTQVVILSGSRVPFILRNTHVSSIQFDLDIGQPRLIWRYRMLGDCYVHHIMNGEAVKDMTWNGDYDLFDLK